MVAWDRWSGVYESILQDFGYDRASDEAARDELDALLAGHDVVPDARLASLLEGAEVVVFGPAGDDIDWRYARGERSVIIAADGATSLLAERGVTPHLIVTDLDGDVWKQTQANRDGSIVVVHAHGDNRDALAEWVPRLHGPLVGTTQAEPVGRVRNFGGFTDGDRAVYVADHFGARRVTLVGFDFDEPAPKPGLNREEKRKKLRWARVLIQNVGVPVRVPTEGGPFSF